MTVFDFWMFGCLGICEPRGSLEPHGRLAASKTAGEDGLHLRVVLDGSAEVLDIFGVILKKEDNIASCDWHIREANYKSNKWYVS